MDKLHGENEGSTMTNKEYLDRAVLAVPASLASESVLRALPCAVYWKNAHTQYVGCNAAYAHLVGLDSVQDIIGKSDEDLGWLAAGDTASQFHKIDEQTLCGESITEQQWLSRPNQSAQRFLVHTLPLYDEEGVIGLVGMVSDFNASEEKGTHYLRHQLKGMDIILATIAHEMRTPLSGLALSASGIKEIVPELLAGYRAASAAGLMEASIGESHLELLDRIIKGFSHPLQQCDQVIDMLLANVSCHKRIEYLKPCSMGACINQALSRYVFSWEKPEIIWDDTQDFTFWGQEAPVINMLINLMRNATYFIAKARKGDIRIWLKQGEAFNTLHFKDTGYGIKAEHISHVFDEFFTVGNNKGVGVGLAFCRLTMNALGGRISCHSVLNEYAEFVLDFPVKKPDNQTRFLNNE